MKKYRTLNETERMEKLREKRDALILFQYLLRNCEPLNVTYHGKAHAIADGLQPWIEALEIRIREE